MQIRRGWIQCQHELYKFPLFFSLFSSKTHTNHKHVKIKLYSLIALFSASYGNI